VATRDANGKKLEDPLFDRDGKAITSTAQKPMHVTEIQWSSDDALPFPVCISSVYLDGKGVETELSDVSVVYGNVVLADQGISMPSMQYGPVPEPTLQYPPNVAADRCQILQPTYFPVRFRPQVQQSPLTQAVRLPLAGAPATSSAVPLTANGYVSLKDSNGFVSLMVAADKPLEWPKYFAVVANVNAGNSQEFDLTVLFDPPGGPAGVTGPVTLEKFVGLSFTEGATNFAPTLLSASNFIAVASGYTLPTTAPAAYSSTPTPLPTSGTVNLEDASSSTFLQLVTTPPLSWPPLFGIVSQGELQHPDVFNLLVMYSPKGGSVGVTLPVLVEQVLSVRLETAAAQFATLSNLITVKTFEEGPNPSLSSYDLMNFDATQALPVMTLTTKDNTVTTTWTVAPDLLGDGPDDTQFVVEVDTDGTAYLRFGDGTNGKLPKSGDTFTAKYRIGNGTAGNVGAGSLTNFAAGVLADSMIESCTNPMPATGGIDPETNAQICRRAPQAFLSQERAVTLADYVNVTEQNPQIEDAAAALRWTGSWYTVFITAEPQGNGNLSKSLQRALTKQVNRYRLAGQDILIEPPQYVSLDLVLIICVEPDAFQRDVEKALLQVLGSGTLPNGQPALFAPQNFELGETVYLSPIYAAARTVPGVQTVTAKVFEPQGQKTKVYLQQGYMPMNAFQVARLDNDPSMPDHGQLRLVMKGGK
jgi:hypothetical protein